MGPSPSSPSIPARSDEHALRREEGTLVARRRCRRDSRVWRFGIRLGQATPNRARGEECLGMVLAQRVPTERTTSFDVSRLIRPLDAEGPTRSSECRRKRARVRPRPCGLPRVNSVARGDYRGRVGLKETSARFPSATLSNPERARWARGPLPLSKCAPRSNTRPLRPRYRPEPLSSSGDSPLAPTR